MKANIKNWRKMEEKTNESHLRRFTIANVDDKKKPVIVPSEKQKKQPSNKIDTFNRVPFSIYLQISTAGTHARTSGECYPLWCCSTELRRNGFNVKQRKRKKSYVSIVLYLCLFSLKMEISFLVVIQQTLFQTFPVVFCRWYCTISLVAMRLISEASRYLVPNGVFGLTDGRPEGNCLTLPY